MSIKCMFCFPQSQLLLWTRETQTTKCLELEKPPVIILKSSGGSRTKEAESFIPFGSDIQSVGCIFMNSRQK